MNSKAIKRQLLAAIAMVLVAAIALGSSTYAWFVASGTVTATGMKVQAKAEGGLAIRWGGSASELWATTASAKMNDATALLPASTFDLSHWTYAKAMQASASDADTATYTDITNTVFAGDAGAFAKNDYVVMQPFQIRSTASDKLAKGLYVSKVEVTRGNGSADDQKDLDMSIRVGVRMKTETGYTGNFVYAPISGGSSNYTWKDASQNNKTSAVTLATVGTAADNNSLLVNKADSIPFEEGSPIKVEIFIWYEGEDVKLYSDNFALNDLSVSVEFASYEFENKA